MKLKNTVIIFTALTLMTFSVLAVFLIRATNLLEQEAKALELGSESISGAKELKSRLLTHNRNSFLYLLNKESEALESRQAQRAEMERIVATIDSLTSSSEEAALLDGVREAIARYFEKRSQLQNLGLPAVEQYTLVSRDVDEAIVAIDKFVQMNRLQMSELVDSINKQNLQADNIAILLLSIAGILLLGVIYGVLTNGVRPLLSLSRAITLYSGGASEIRAKPAGFREIQAVTANFNSMADRLEEKRQDQLRFLAAIAHDLRNPLNAMSLASQMLINGGREEDHNLLAIIFRQVKNLDRMVGDLLDSTRIEAGKLELDFSTVDVGALIKDAVKLYSTGSGLYKFNIKIPETPLSCRCDSGRLTQVINNLLSNAVKYSPNGGEITTTAFYRDNKINITVSDQGIGISPEDLRNIFKPFHRTSATKNTFPGIGLGLSASRRIIEAHGGRLQVESTPGKGSSFSIELPAGGTSEQKLTEEQ